MNTDPTSRLTLIAPPEEEALTLEQVKQFLRIEHNADDALISVAITAARASAEEYLRVLLLQQTYSYEFTSIAHILPLPVGPAQSVALVSAYDADGNDTEVEAGQYRLTIDGYGVVFPHVPSGKSFAIEFTAGLLDVPAPVRQGMLHHIAAMIENRAGQIAMPELSRQLYQPYRRVRL